MRRAALNLLFCLPALAQGVQAPQKEDPFAPLRFLVGEWVGEGEGKPGSGDGAFTLLPELGGRILVRRSRADYPAAQGRPALHHEDLLLVFPEGGQVKALYTDNEGHVIRYLLSFPAGQAVFTSEPGPGPRFRLSYQDTGRGSVDIRFEIAAPGKDFTTYLQGKAKRKP